MLKEIPIGEKYTGDMHIWKLSPRWGKSIYIYGPSLDDIFEIIQADVLIPGKDPRLEQIRLDILEFQEIRKGGKKIGKRTNKSESVRDRDFIIEIVREI